MKNKLDVTYLSKVLGPQEKHYILVKAARAPVEPIPRVTVTAPDTPVTSRTLAFKQSFGT